ncbi:methyltransferase domain-containing protein [Nannocystis bainbridge]|uniref:Methyltransferase domain-containing protein n=1 Tax=Nannocystis bainbridge TaxID=2995303 RepID=A0ABT5EC16_9BACT|nr:methyltransferase domain-containing protein [Nannocystis bainbridge]MDC0722402.1 methyltransferase domain-containing protein [Nannocystis bainbridge]
MLDREISPVWHDRFARLIVRNLPNLPEVLALDIHCGTGRGTGELLHRLGAGAKILAIDPDEGALELAKTRIRAEWKNRVYFKSGHFDDVTAMADDSYNLVVANLVLGESVDLEPALGEMIRVGKIGGRILATVPLHGTWEEVEDIFAEILRDAGMTAALRRLEALRAIRPTGPQLGKMLRNLGAVEDDYVIEHERFQLLFPSGREFLFAPVIEHGPLQMWKAVIGKDGAPQELFWRLKEAIDTYYAGHVLAVTVHAGLIHVEVAKGTARPGPRLAARFWRHYPELDKLWGGLAVGYARVSDPILPFSDADVSDFDLDIDIDESDPRRRTGAMRALRQTGRQAAVETPSPEDFGLRFRPRDPTEASEIRALDAETSGLRARVPGSEASGLRALSQLRDTEISAVRPASSFRRIPVAADEDDFSELNSFDTRSHKAVPAARSPAPAAEPDEDLSRLAETEDDFSNLNDSPLLPRRPISSSWRRSSESSSSRPVPTDLRGDSESSAHRALAELSLRPGDSATAGRRPSGPIPVARRAEASASQARRPTSGPSAEASGRRPLGNTESSVSSRLPDAAESGRRPLGNTESSVSSRLPDASGSGKRPLGPTETSVSSRLPDASGSGKRALGPTETSVSSRLPDASSSGKRPLGTTETSGLLAGASGSGKRPLGPTETSVASRLPDASGSGKRPLGTTETSGLLAGASGSGKRPLGTTETSGANLLADAAASGKRLLSDSASGKRPLPDLRKPEAEAADSETSGSRPAARPTAPPEASRPALPSLRLPDPKPTSASSSGSMFRPPTFKSPGEESLPPVKHAFRPPGPESVDEEEPEEIDELEPVDEFEPDDEPVFAAPRPPPPKAPPPRPPSLSPDKKK